MMPSLYAACEKAFHVVTAEGKILRGGRASLFVLEQIGYKIPARILVLPPFIWMVELGYRIVAANRPFFARFLFRNE